MIEQRVNVLLDENNSWREDLLHNTFLPQDVEDILNIPTGEKSSKDEIIWHLDKKGQFTVNSVYHLAMETNDWRASSPSNKENLSNQWKSLWKIGVLPRIKIGAWKIIKDIIPSMVNTLNEGVDLNPFCHLCGKKVKTTTRLIWECKVSKKIWLDFNLNSLNLFIWCRKGWTTKDFWNWMVENLNEEDIATGTIVMWNTWNIRNRANQISNISVADIIHKCTVRYINEWEVSYLKIKKARESRSHASQVT